MYQKNRGIMLYLKWNTFFPMICGFFFSFLHLKRLLSQRTENIYFSLIFHNIISNVKKCLIFKVWQLLRLENFLMRKIIFMGMIMQNFMPQTFFFQKLEFFFILDLFSLFLFLKKLSYYKFVQKRLNYVFACF